jgi:antitoxin CptB
MKELDLLLENYLATDYLVADTAEKARFIELLQLEDDELFAVLMTGEWKTGNQCQ